MFGSLRLVWFSTLVNVPSALSLSRSVIENVLLSPAGRFPAPGPTTEPTCAFPNRPIGFGTGPEPLPVVHAVPGVQFGYPGQVKAPGLSQWRRVRLAGVELTPATISGCWLRWPPSKPETVPFKPDPVPDGSP